MEQELGRAMMVGCGGVMLDLCEESVGQTEARE